MHNRFLRNDLLIYAFRQGEEQNLLFCEASNKSLISEKALTTIALHE